ncbi:MAG: hypothetical protein ACKVP0_05725 [Pirellulaceae bacterium]
MGDRIIRTRDGRCQLARQSLLCFVLSFCPPLLCHFLSDSLLAADSTLLTIKQADIGFGGSYRSGFWTPISLALAANGSPVNGELQLVASDGENVPVVFFAAGAGLSSSNIQLEPGKEVTVHSYLKAGPQKSRISARLIDRASGKILWQASLPGNLPAPLSATTPLVITLGSSVGVEDALKFTRRSEADALVAAEVKSAAELPDQWWGYEGIETIFLPAGSAGILGQLNSSQTIAIQQWVREGGRLVLSSGAQTKQLLGDNSPWKDLIPGQLIEVGPMRDAATLETLTGEAFPFTDDGSRPLVAHLTAVRGKTELTEGSRAANVPLVIRTPHGLGEITFVAFDLDGERFAKWPGRPRFLSTLLRESKAQETPGGQAGVRLGYSDLTGQLRGALDQFPGVQVINFTTVALLIVAYIILIGPVDNFLLQQLGASRNLTWITFPLVALLFCGIAWYSAGWSHGNQMRLNQAEIIDIDGQHVRGTAWLHLYSPATKTYDLAMRPSFPTEVKTGATYAYLTWQGLPGSGLGGLDAQQVALNVVDPYAIEFPSAAAGLRSLPIQVGSSKSLAARWWQDIPLPAASKLALNEHGVPTGDLVNPLDVELQDCIFTFNIWMYRLKKLGPGERFSLSDARPLYLESRLQQHKVNDFKDSATPWVRDSADVPAILQMLMYHEAARGQNYTGLTHRYQTHLDLSGQLTRGRGLLVGRVEKPAAQLKVDGSPLPADQIQSWTYYRIVIPVSPKSAATP